MSSSLQALLTNVLTLVGSVDPNLGALHRNPQRWSTLDDLKFSGSIVLAGGGAWDSAPRVGNRVVRFWYAEAATRTGPFSNGSDLFTHTIALRAFWAAETGFDVAETLRSASTAVLDKLSLRASERSLSTGSGYLGYLTQRPSMTAVQGAALEGPNVQGHSVIVTATFFEEVLAA